MTGILLISLFQAARIAFGEVLFNKRKYNLRKGQISESDVIIPSEITTTSFRKEKTRLLHKADSVEQLRLWLIAEDRRRRDTLDKADI